MKAKRSDRRVDRGMDSVDDIRPRKQDEELFNTGEASFDMQREETREGEVIYSPALHTRRKE